LCTTLATNARLASLLAQARKPFKELPSTARIKDLTPYQMEAKLRGVIESNALFRLKQLALGRAINARVRPMELGKKVLHAVATSDVPRLKRLASTALTNGRSITYFMEKLAESTSPLIARGAPFTEKEVDLATFLLRAGGQRVLRVAHKALGLPSEGFLREHDHLFTLRPSPSLQSLKADGWHNLKAILDVSLETPGLDMSGPHAMVFDEVRLDDK
jgi:hypothetical protein